MVGGASDNGSPARPNVFLNFPTVGEVDLADKEVAETWTTRWWWRRRWIKVHISDFTLFDASGVVSHTPSLLVMMPVMVVSGSPNRVVDRVL